MIELSALTIADAAASITAALIVWNIQRESSSKKEIVKSINTLSTHVERTNGRLGTMEQIFEAHTKEDAKNQAAVTRELDGIWKAVGKKEMGQ